MAYDSFTEPLQHWHDRLAREAVQAAESRTPDCLKTTQLYAIGCGLETATPAQLNHINGSDGSAGCRLCRRGLALAAEIADSDLHDPDVPPLFDTPAPKSDNPETAEDDLARAIRHSGSGHELTFPEPAVEPAPLPQAHEEPRR